MSHDSISHLQQLPAEILFRIFFDDLDAVTLFFSVGQTCRRLRTLVHSHDRVSVDFTLLSKPHFHCLLRLLNPHHVTSLTLTHQAETFDAVKMFCSHYRRRQPFDRLQSLTLHEVLERNLRNIFKRIQPASVSSFKVKTNRSVSRPARTSVNALSSMIANSCMRRLDVDIRTTHVRQIQWPKTNTIKQLKLNSWLGVNEICTLLGQLLHMQILWVDNISGYYGQ